MSRLPDTLNTIIIENVKPEINSGRYAIKREVGDRLEVTADIFKEGHDIIGGMLRYKTIQESGWHEAPMHLVENDRWAGFVELTQNTRYLYTIGAFIRTFETWREELGKKHRAIPDLTSELLEGESQIRAALDRAKGDDKKALEQWFKQWTTQKDQESRIQIALQEDFALLVNRNEERHAWTVYDHELEVMVDRTIQRDG